MAIVSLGRESEVMLSAKHENPRPTRLSARGIGHRLCWRNRNAAIFRAKMGAMRYPRMANAADDAAKRSRRPVISWHMTAPIPGLRILLLACAGIAIFGTGAAAQTNPAAPTPSTSPAGPPAHD